jgi:hypothetical protein
LGFLRFKPPYRGIAGLRVFELVADVLPRSVICAVNSADFCQIWRYKLRSCTVSITSSRSAVDMQAAEEPEH